MPVGGFHPEALIEYRDALRFLRRKAGAEVAGSFSAAVTTAVGEIVKSPARWPVVNAEGTRRYLLRKFPFALVYDWNDREGSVVIMAVMHSSRRPNYGQGRLD